MELYINYLRFPESKELNDDIVTKLDIMKRTLFIVVYSTYCKS